MPDPSARIAASRDLLIRLGLRRDPTRLGGLEDRRVVALVLIGVGLRELGQRPVEGVARAEVGGDRDAVAAIGHGPGRASSPQTSA